MLHSVLARRKIVLNTSGCRCTAELYDISLGYAFTVKARLEVGLPLSTAIKADAHIEEQSGECLNVLYQDMH